MDARVLQRLRRRVQRGEPLSEAEMRRLRTAADVEGGAALRITLGLALSNAGSDAEALSVLAAAGRSGEPAASLARARALVRAGRLEDAERALADAILAHPRDLSLRKARVLVALRRGDGAGAARFLADLRARAPTDDEVRALAEALAAGSGSSALEVLLDGAWEWFGRAGSREHGGLRATWTEEESGAPDVLAHVVPVLADEAAPGLLSREGPAGLAVTYLSDGVKLDADAAVVSLEAVDLAAWRHLEDDAAEPRPVIVDRGQPRLSPEPLGLWALCEADGADGARLLTTEQRRRLFDVVGAGPYRVSLARPELALVAPLLDPSAVALLESVEPGTDGIRGRFALQPDGTLQRLGPS
jgi:tetratricopeptide (TPR) repeat protein